MLSWSPLLGREDCASGFVTLIFNLSLTRRRSPTENREVRFPHWQLCFSRDDAVAQCGRPEDGCEDDVEEDDEDRPELLPLEEVDPPQLLPLPLLALELPRSPPE